MEQKVHMYSQRGIRLLKKYKSLSPMMRIIFAGEAADRYHQDSSLKPLMEDMEAADRICHYLLVMPVTTANNMAHYLTGEVEHTPRPEHVLNYVYHALAYGDKLTFRMSYLYHKKYQSLTDFRMEHPAHIREAVVLSKYLQLISHPDLAGFSFHNSDYCAPYHQWVQETKAGRDFNRRRSCYTVAVKEVLNALNLRPQPCRIASANSGKRFIQEKYANGDLVRT